VVEWTDGRRLTMDTPVVCRISVQGVISPDWSPRLGGLRITPAGGADRDGEATTELRGELRDQAALLEVLRTLHRAGFPLLGVNCEPGPPAP
jgi:hypothetical protein